MAFGVTASTLLVLIRCGIRAGERRRSPCRGRHHVRIGAIALAIQEHRLGHRRQARRAGRAFLGAKALSSLSTKNAAPVMAAILMAIGLYVLLRFSLRTPPAVKPGQPATARNSWPRSGFSAVSSTHPAAAAGDPSPPARARAERPRRAPSSVRSAFRSYLARCRPRSASWADSVNRVPAQHPDRRGLALGGVIAAPFAAWLVSKASPAILGTAVGGVIVLTTHKNSSSTSKSALRGRLWSTPRSSWHGRRSSSWPGSPLVHPNSSRKSSKTRSPSPRATSPAADAFR